MYNRSIKEYKDAKETAAASLGSKSLPSNFEVAIELDQLSEELEGSERNKRLIQMRETALQVMKLIKIYNPRLFGSVWRGTARQGSDIDIVAYSETPDMIFQLIITEFPVTEIKEQLFIVNSVPRKSTHIESTAGEFGVEIVVRSPEEQFEEKRCEIYGDVKRGLGLSELEKLMKVDPLRRFIPRRRHR